MLELSAPSQFVSGSTTCLSDSPLSVHTQSSSTKGSFGETLASVQFGNSFPFSNSVSPALPALTFQSGTPFTSSDFGLALPAQAAFPQGVELSSSKDGRITSEPPSVPEISQDILSIKPDRPKSAGTQSVVSPKADERANTNRSDLSKRSKRAQDGVWPHRADEAGIDDAVSTIICPANPATSSVAESQVNVDQLVDTNSAGGKVGENRGKNVTANGSAPAAVAFAVRVQNNGSAEPKAAFLPPASGESVNPAGELPNSEVSEPLRQLARPLQGEGSSLSPSAQMQPQAGAAVFGQFQPPANSTPTKQSSASPVSHSDLPPVPETKAISATPLRSMQVQIVGQDNQRIDLKMIERSGSLSLSVRALDGNLTRTLQAHLPELTTKLAGPSIQAEWWTPKLQTGNLSDNAAGKGSSNQDSSASQQRDESSRQGQGQQQSGREKNQPDWIDELTALGTTRQTRKEYIWHQ